MKVEEKFRVGAYWLTIGMSLWTLCYFYVHGTERGHEWATEDLSVSFLGGNINGRTGAKLIMLIAPTMLAACLCQLLVTSTPLPRYTSIWINNAFAWYSPGGRKNQKGVGGADFNYVAIFLVVLPVFAHFVSTVNRRLVGNVSSQSVLREIASAAGYAGIMSLSFFLIPVARHSVLLVAMGWSPVHALRIHIWAGFASFFWTTMHGIGCIIEGLLYLDESIWHQIIPGPSCWAWQPFLELSEPDIERGRSLTPECSHQFYNFTGIIAFFFFGVLCFTSLNWFRRKYYRLFYISHIICAVGMLVGAVAHWRPMVLYILPSIVYYLVSTAPVLVQAVASHYRGGVHICKVVNVFGASGCKEVQVAVTPETVAALDNQPSMYVKLCVPSISLIWHPFTVYRNKNDPTTVRFLFRPVGPFTKQLAKAMEQDNPPITVLDGLYHTSNRCLEALQHDSVTIICGGVAITPFLSMIPSVLKALGVNVSDERQARTKKLVLHWACRDQGLIDYIAVHYLTEMKVAADSVGLSFDIHIHQTRTKKPLDPIIGQDALSMTDFTEKTEHYDGSSISISDGEEQGSTRGHIYRQLGGHAMELGRFMPARYSTFVQNVPVFLAWGGSMWLFFYIIWYYYDVFEYRVHPSLERTLSLIICLLAAIALGIAFEVVALAAKSMGTNQNTEKEEIVHEIDVDEYVVGSGTIEYHFGRPNADEILCAAEGSESPGIFMCGPVAMTQMVREETQKYNSDLGFTRFALYEEPFEM